MEEQEFFPTIKNSICENCKHLLALEVDTNFELINEQGTLIDIAPNQFICTVTGRDIVIRIIKCNKFINNFSDSIIFKNPYNI